MAETYRFTAGTGDNPEFIPVANGTHDLTGISLAHDSGEIRLAFYRSDRTTLATPTAGQIVFRGGSIAGQYLEASENATVQASSVQAGNASYTPPFFNGPLSHLRATFQNTIAGDSVAFVTITYHGD